MAPTASWVSPEGTDGPVSKLGFVSMFACADADSAAASTTPVAVESPRSRRMIMTHLSFGRREPCAGFQSLRPAPLGLGVRCQCPESEVRLHPNAAASRPAASLLLDVSP